MKLVMRSLVFVRAKYQNKLKRKLHILQDVSHTQTQTKKPPQISINLSTG